MKMQPYVKMWYDALALGKFMGLRCTACGGYQFPPVPVCSACFGWSMEWSELSGRGQLTSFNMPLRAQAGNESLWPYVNGSVVLEEGPEYGGLILGVGPDDAERVHDRIPLPVQAEVLDRGDYSFLAFRISVFAE